MSACCMFDLELINWKFKIVPNHVVLALRKMLCGNLSQIDSQIISILYPLSAAFPDQLVFRGWVHCEKAKAHNSGWYLAKSNKIKSNVVFLVIGNGIYTLFSCKFSFLWFGHWKLTTSTEPICLNKFLEPPYCPPWSKIGFAQAQPGKFSKKHHNGL